MKNAALLVTVLAACTTEGIPVERETPSTPVASKEITVVEGHEIVVATGGALAVHVEDQASIGLEGSASDGYAVEPYEVNRWPQTISTDYFVRANVSGMGSYEIVTSKGIATGIVKSADVARVELVPANYELDGSSPFAFAANRTQMRAALYDADGRRLVDATLAIGATQTAWDSAFLPPASGAQSVTLGAGSFGERTFTIDVVQEQGIVRVEEVRRGDRTCFHAYAGSTEIAAALTITGGTPDPTATNCAFGAGASARL
jgi:hypothetical protein